MNDLDPTQPNQDKSIADLLAQVTEQSNELARKEVQLAKAELELKAKRVGVGIGAFGGAGLIAFLATGALTATLILALAELLDPWLAGLIVTLAYLAVAGVMALIGRRKVEEASPPVPEKAIESSKADIEEVRESAKEGMAR